MVSPRSFVARAINHTPDPILGRFGRFFPKPYVWRYAERQRVWYPVYVRSGAQASEASVVESRGICRLSDKTRKPLDVGADGASIVASRSGLRTEYRLCPAIAVKYRIR